VGEHPLERILVNHCCYGLLASFAETADDSPRAIHQHVGIGAKNSGWEHNAEPDDSANGNIRIHVEQDAACRNVSSFGKMLAGIIGADGNRKFERESYGISKIGQYSTFAHTPLYTPAFERPKVTLVSSDKLKDMLNR
jgi:hypothetical protein